jgi:hypothetical protein
MATYMPASREAQLIDKHHVPFTLTALQTLVGGFIRFVVLPSGDTMVINEASLDQLGFLNKTASRLAGQNIYGDVVVCEPHEIA